MQIDKAISDIRLSIIIVHYNTPELLTNCLNSINKFIGDISIEVIVVDNNSKEHPLPELLRDKRNIKIICLPENMGFSYANNVGARAASGEAVFFLNSDAYLIDSSIKKALVSFLEKNEKSLWGFKLLWPDGSFQNSFSREITFLDYTLSYTPIGHLGRFIKRIGYHKYQGKPLDDITAVPIVYATAMLMWKKDFLSLNGFYDKYFMYFEDMDFCYRFRKKFNGNIYYYPYVSIIHSVKGSSLGNNKINFIFLKSKYIFGLRRFKLLPMVFYILLDISLIILTLGFESIFNRNIDKNH